MPKQHPAVTSINRKLLTNIRLERSKAAAQNWHEKEFLQNRYAHASKQHPAFTGTKSKPVTNVRLERSEAGSQKWHEKVLLQNKHTH